ncbi:MAG: hypothetical protein MUF22_00640 [Chitinispirillaceae bacterium]|nr:hypothetical protein [Chitinispirillaceae bacterium]
MLTAVCCAAMLCVCRNPFFPPSGPPPGNTISQELRATPRGVVDQLIKSYESRDILLFTDLFPEGNTFRFYVSPAFASTYMSKPYINPPEPRDTMMQYTGEFPYYNYWVQDWEVQSHRNLFLRSQTIRFIVPPNVNTGDFRYRVDAMGDTIGVEVLMTEGLIHIESDKGDFDIYIDKQVFLLERDSDNLWVIRKWYDFGIR